MEDLSRNMAELKGAVVALDQKMDRRFDLLEERFDRKFLWLLGAQLTTLLTIIAGMFGVMTRLL